MMFRLLAGLVALVLPLSAMAQEKVLRAVMHADVRVIDPIWTTQTIANIHGALVYDTLFGNDANQKPQPQMVGKYEISPDRLTYTFTLRDGLKFHDGSPVTTKDVIASLKRWGAKDGVGQRLMGYVTELDAVDDKTFTHGAARALRHGAGIARQERQLDRRHHAREGSAHRPAAAGQGIDRLRSLHLRQGPVGAGQQGGLPQEQGLRAAARQRAAVVLRRQQDPGRRPHRAGVDLRSADGDVGAGQRRDRLLREPQHRLPAAARQGQGREADEDRQDRQHAGHDPAQSPASALRQRQGAAGDVLPDQPGGLPARHRRRSEILPRLPRPADLRRPLRERRRHRLHEGVQSQEGAAAPQGGGLQGRADHRAGRPPTTTPSRRPRRC